MAVRINVEARPHEVIEEVWFGDDLGPFTFTATEAADLLSALLLDDDDERTVATVKAKIKWVRAGFAEEDWALVEKRLADPTHPLRTTHLLDMFEALSSEVAMRPPTSSGGSSSTPPRKSGGGKQKRKGSTSGG